MTCQNLEASCKRLSVNDQNDLRDGKKSYSKSKVCLSARYYRRTLIFSGYCIVIVSIVPKLGWRQEWPQWVNKFQAQSLFTNSPVEFEPPSNKLDYGAGRLSIVAKTYQWGKWPQRWEEDTSQVHSLSASCPWRHMLAWPGHCIVSLRLLKIYISNHSNLRKIAVEN